jgi:hypothetical protein
VPRDDGRAEVLSRATRKELPDGGVHADFPNTIEARIRNVAGERVAEVDGIQDATSAVTPGVAEAACAESRRARFRVGSGERAQFIGGKRPSGDGEPMHNGPFVFRELEDAVGDELLKRRREVEEIAGPLFSHQFRLAVLGPGARAVARASIDEAERAPLEHRVDHFKEKEGIPADACPNFTNDFRNSALEAQPILDEPHLLVLVERIEGDRNRGGGEGRRALIGPRHEKDEERKGERFSKNC